MTISPVYIAAPLASSLDPAAPAFPAHVRRAVELGRIAVAEGLAPCVPHPFLEQAGIGADGDGMAIRLSLLSAVMMRASGALWVLIDPTGLTPGVEVEQLTWGNYRSPGSIVRGPWQFWRARAARLGVELDDDGGLQ